MTQTEALKLALEALENSVDTIRREYETDWRHGLPTRKAQLDGMKQALDGHEDAITAIKEALAQPIIQNYLEKDNSQPEQEPVAWMWMLDGEVWDLCSTKDRFTPIREGHIQIPLYTTPPQRKPLTDEELYKVFPAIATYHEANKTLYRSIARAIEAAHGITGEQHG